MSRKNKLLIVLWLIVAFALLAYSTFSANTRTGRLTESSYSQWVQMREGPKVGP